MQAKLADEKLEARSVLKIRILDICEDSSATDVKSGLLSLWNPASFSNGLIEEGRIIGITGAQVL